MNRIYFILSLLLVAIWLIAVFLVKTNMALVHLFIILAVVFYIQALINSAVPESRRRRFKKI